MGLLEISAVIIGLLAAVIYGFILFTKIAHRYEAEVLNYELDKLSIPRDILFREGVVVHIGERHLFFKGFSIKKAKDKTDKYGQIETKNWDEYEIFDPRKPERFSHVPCGYVKESKTIDTGETRFEIMIWV